MKEITVSEELLARREVGTFMANVCFNLAQLETLDEHTRRMLDTLRKQWDAIPATQLIRILQLQDATRDQLRQLMSNISEDCYCAGWLSGLERELWDRVFLGKHNKNFGGAPIAIEQLEKLRVMVRNTNSWWIWDDKLIGQRCITFDEACQMFGTPGALVCNCPPPNEYTLPSYDCPVHIVMQNNQK